MGRTYVVGTILLAVAVLTPACGMTWYVDGSVSSSGDGATWETALKTIQEGIDKALEGDTVTVAEGVYIENIHFDGKNIILTGTDPLNPDVVAGTIIDGNQSGSVVTFDGTENETCVLSGFTLQKGKAEYGGGVYGGPFSDRLTHATIRNNVVTENVASYYGGGLAHCAGLVENNIIKGNSADTHGGGLYSCQGTIQNNVIAGNGVEGYGGGMAMCYGTIQSNTIFENSAGIYGGGLYLCNGIIRNNTVSTNSAWTSGGGFAECDGEIYNNIIAGNFVESAAGGGLADCDAMIHSNTIVGNAAGVSTTSRGGGLFNCTGWIQNCIIWGNTALEAPQFYAPGVTPTHCCIEGWVHGGTGNVTSDPRFVDADGADDNAETYGDNDYRLLEDSPCIDAGKNEEWMTGASLNNS